MNPRIIAEIAKEHNGDFPKAVALIEDAALAGAQAVKFQTYSLDDINDEHVNYQRYRDCYFSLKKLLDLKDIAESKGIDFYVSCFSIVQLPTLSRHFTRIKIPSTYLTYSDFVKLACDNFKEIHISTGMHRYDVILKILDYYSDYIKDKKKVLIPYHCVSLYPTPYDSLKMCRVIALRNRYGIVGYSDHSVGNKACMIAAHNGADFIEKHYAFCETNKPWCWSSESLKSFNTSLRSETEMVKDRKLTKQELSNFDFYKKEFCGINKSHLRLLTS